MTFRFSRQGLQGRERALERLLEILPGAVSWAVLAGMTALSFWRPLLAAVLIIAFDFYWLLRLFYMTLFLVLSYGKLSAEKETDWMERIREEREGWKGEAPPSPEEVVHVVIFPVIKESKEVLEPGVASIARQKFPARQILVVYAVEERAQEAVKEAVRELREKYRRGLLDFLVALHPDGVPGEARVKGANVTHAARLAAEHLRRKGIPLERAVVSCFDADTVVHPSYFTCLTYHFLACPDRCRASFQPIPVYHNNIWEAPGFARVLDIGSSFFQMVEATHPEKLVSFSSHSVSFKALEEVDYWPVDMISDDSAIYWKAFIHYDGDYRVVPMYVTVSMDMVSARGWWRTAASVYRQKRRWAWGVESFPIVMRGFLKARRIPALKKLSAGFKLLEGHINWATWGLLLAVIGWLPALTAGREFSSTVLYYSAPRIMGTIFNLASLSLATTIVLSLLLLPRGGVRHPVRKRIGHALEWLMVPVIAVFFSTLPALDAQTRLALGRYMEFWVTEKRRGVKT